jgi:hypothetical protein
MCARTVSLQLKPNSVTAFTQTIEKASIPLLRKQSGFQDEMVFVVPGRHGRSGPSACGISKSPRRLLPAAPLPTCCRLWRRWWRARRRCPPIRWRTRPFTRSSLASPPEVDRLCVCGGTATAALSLGRQSNMEVSRGPCLAYRAFLGAHSGQARWAY